jgi:hypothetical protein
MDQSATKVFFFQADINFVDGSRYSGNWDIVISIEGLGGLPEMTTSDITTTLGTSLFDDIDDGLLKAFAWTKTWMSTAASAFVPGVTLLNSWLFDKLGMSKIFDLDDTVDEVVQSARNLLINIDSKIYNSGTLSTAFETACDSVTDGFSFDEFIYYLNAYLVRDGGPLNPTTGVVANLQEAIEYGIAEPVLPGDAFAVRLVTSDEARANIIKIGLTVIGTPLLVYFGAKIVPLLLKAVRKVINVLVMKYKKNQTADLTASKTIERMLAAGFLSSDALLDTSSSSYQTLSNLIRSSSGKPTR